MEVSDADLPRVAAQLGLSLDAASSKFLTHTASCDVHACPGSGKTTLLVAKLALLAKSWRWRDRGVLVLSHTNVARREIEARLAHDNVASRLFAFPHYVGTIQSFVDRFLAFPYLRDVGVDGVAVPEPTVDDEEFARRAWAWFSAAGWKQFKQARAFLAKKHDQGRGVVTTMSYMNASLDLDIGGLAGPQTATGTQLRQLKDRLACEGVFRYRDMFAFARASLKRHPFVLTALRQRFPWVFIDEVQDTAADQEALLDEIFGGACILQKLGDRNQAIFRGDGDEQSTTTVAVDALDLPKSHRLSPTIAKFASALTAAHPQVLVGNAMRSDRAHTVFLFSDTQLSAVIPAFGDLILGEWPELPAGFVAKAVGFRRKVLEPPKVPGRISDYWSEYHGDGSPEHFVGKTLLDFVRRARRLLAVERNFYASHRMLLDGLALFVRKLRNEKTLSRRQWWTSLRGQPEQRAVQDVIAKLLQAATLDESLWAESCTQLRALLAKGTVADEADEVLTWSVDILDHIDLVRSRTNVFSHSNGGRTVNIDVATIHAVKGETHDATLILETFDHQHDLRTLVPYLSGAPPKKKRGPGVRVTDFMKRAFVAISRPKELVCLALHKSGVSEYQAQQLASYGWAIRDLTSTG